MKKVRLNGSDIKSLDEIIISGSKSESNRALILKSIFQKISIINLSSSDDTNILEKNFVELPIGGIHIKPIISKL